MRGIFIAMEGLDGSGGTTQTQLLVEWMRRAKNWPEVISTREPSDGSVGQFIRSLLTQDHAHRVDDTVLPYLFAADRRDHLNREVIPALQRRCAVVTDRYYHSSLAYQSLSVGLAEVVRLNDGFQRPDLTIFLALSPEMCLDRIIARGGTPERFETLDRLRSIENAYESVFVHCRARGEKIVVVPANESIEDIHHTIITHVRDILAEMQPH